MPVPAHHHSQPFRSSPLFQCIHRVMMIHARRAVCCMHHCLERVQNALRIYLWSSAFPPLCDSDVWRRSLGPRCTLYSVLWYSRHCGPAPRLTRFVPSLYCFVPDPRTFCFQLRHIPTVGTTIPVFSYLEGLNFFHNARRKLQEGYDRVRSSYHITFLDRIT